MESLIKVRSLAAQLNEKELNLFIRQIVKRFGAEEIITYLFNHFCFEYIKHKTHDENLSEITEMLCNLTSSKKSKCSNKRKARGKKKQTANESAESVLEAVSTTHKIDKLPSQMIKLCASYLDLESYMNFSISNRSIYIASNPPSLVALDIAGMYDYDQLGTTEFGLALHRFKALETLVLCPCDFNEFEMLADHQNMDYTFPHLKALHLDYSESGSDPEQMNRFLATKLIPLQQIEKLHCSGFGDADFDEDGYDVYEFRKLLSAFPNVSHLVFDGINLFTPEQKENDAEITTEQNILPKLAKLECELLNDVASELGRELITKYGEQLVALCWNSRTTTIALQTARPKRLQQLHVAYPDAVMLSILTRTARCEQLKAITLRYFDDADKSLMQETITASLVKYRDLEYLALYCQEEEPLMDIVLCIEMAFMELKYTGNTKDKLILYISLETADDDLTMKQVELCIDRLVNAMDVSAVSNFVIEFECKGIVQHADDRKLGLVEYYRRRKHLAEINEKPYKMLSGTDRLQHFKVTICNQGCTVNGYRYYEKWYPVLSAVKPSI